jgi:hypothetical protein
MQVAQAAVPSGRWQGKIEAAGADFWLTPGGEQFKLVSCNAGI